MGQLASRDARWVGVRTLLIGGTPSSGSSLLVSRLARLPGLLCLPETGLFCHGRTLGSGAPATGNPLHAEVPWVDTWAKAAKSMGWRRPYTGGEDAGCPRSPFEWLRVLMPDAGDAVVVEKTPENVFAFEALLAADAEVRVAVTIRRLTAVCESLVVRGFNMLESVLIWFSHAFESLRLHARYRERVLVIDYGSLVSDADTCISRFRRHFALDTGKDYFVKGEVKQRIDRLRDFANWQLEDTSWSRRVDATTAPVAEAKVLGIAFEELVDRLVFDVPDLGLIGTRDLDGTLAALIEPEVRKGPASQFVGDYSSDITRQLANVYRPARQVLAP